MPTCGEMPSSDPSETPAENPAEHKERTDNYRPEMNVINEGLRAMITATDSKLASSLRMRTKTTTARWELSELSASVRQCRAQGTGIAPCGTQNQQKRKLGWGRGGGGKRGTWYPGCGVVGI